MGKSVSEVIVDWILRDIDSSSLLPWQKTYDCYYSFNYMSFRQYTGINRVILPPGEYLTRRQLNELNSKSEVFYQFKKGIIFFPVVYYQSNETEVSLEICVQECPDGKWNSEGPYACYGGGYRYEKRIVNGESRYFKVQVVMRYFSVFERSMVEGPNGEKLPSRVDSGLVIVENSKADEVVQKYLERTGVVVRETSWIPRYTKNTRVVHSNVTTKTEADYFGNLFHELSHSAVDLLGLKSDSYAYEECLVEMCSSMLCAECGIKEYRVETSKEFQNSVSYIKGWRNQIQDWGSKFLSVIRDADKVFNFIMGISYEKS